MAIRGTWEKVDGAIDVDTFIETVVLQVMSVNQQISLPGFDDELLKMWKKIPWNYDYANSCMKHLRNELEKYKKNRLVITGHSLGAL